MDFREEIERRKLFLVEYINRLEALKHSRAFKELTTSIVQAQHDTYKRLTGEVGHDQAMKLVGTCYAYGDVLSWVDRSILAAHHELQAIAPTVEERAQ